MTDALKNTLKISETLAALLQPDEKVLRVEESSEVTSSAIEGVISKWPDSVRIGLRTFLIILPYIFIAVIIKDMDYAQMQASFLQYLPFFILTIIAAWFGQTKMGKTLKKNVPSTYTNAAITETRIIFFNSLGKADAIKISDITALNKDWDNGASVLTVSTDGLFDKQIIARYDIAGATKILQRRLTM